MIRAASWSSPDHCGVVAANGVGNQFHAPPNSNDQLPQLIGRPIKYLSRMTPECRNSLCAAALAMKAGGWTTAGQKRIGVLGAGYGGCLLADQNYFRDYLASGRSLGRGNLFIYTLPTSTLGEIAIALTLTGPSMHVDESVNPLAGLSRHAAELLTDGEADAMLAVWSDATHSVCLAIDASPEAGVSIPNAADPASIALHIANLARRT